MAGTQIPFWDRNVSVGKLQASGLIFVQEKKRITYLEGEVATHDVKAGLYI